MKKSKIRKLIKEEVIKVLKNRKSKSDTDAPSKVKKGKGKSKLHSKKVKDNSLQDKEKKESLS